MSVLHGLPWFVFSLFFSFVKGYVGEGTFTLGHQRYVHGRTGYLLEINYTQGKAGGGFWLLCIIRKLQRIVQIHEGI
ncbi:hypothetical protein B0J18DRAFT_95930 [Chaetomium sp. MPI-SDFR-AT-0129]|nr:hypothetical protein B0J18DRAFT_95930 [Chaetomium sp. MPI-SDFR-AT-0129]